MQAFILFLALFLTWITLSGFFSAFFIVAGILSCLLALVISKKLGVLPCEACRLFYRWRSVTYVLWLVKEIIVSSLDVTRRVWQVTPKISPRLAWVPTRQTSNLGLTLLANSITLTPGTVTVFVEEGRVCVHALCSEGIDSLESGKMDGKIAKVML